MDHRLYMKGGDALGFIKCLIPEIKYPPKPSKEMSENNIFQGTLYITDSSFLPQVGTNLIVCTSSFFQLNKRLVLPSPSSPAGGHQEAAPWLPCPASFWALPLNGQPPEKAGLGSSEHLFGPKTIWHELLVQ